MLLLLYHFYKDALLVVAKSHQIAHPQVEWGSIKILKSATYFLYRVRTEIDEASALNIR
eukprot:IDg5377t1